MAVYVNMFDNSSLTLSTLTLSYYGLCYGPIMFIPMEWFEAKIVFAMQNLQWDVLDCCPFCTSC